MLGLSLRDRTTNKEIRRRIRVTVIAKLVKVARGEGLSPFGTEFCTRDRVKFPKRCLNRIKTTYFKRPTSVCPLSDR